MVYRMNVHLFGSTSSPSVAACALLRTAEDNVTNAKGKIVETVRKNFYVDDMCKSCATAEEAISLVSELCALLDSGGFH